ncbi:MAG: globin [Candidatus Tectomicrobia bacterium]|nr:globin [Candidatus Tectomicrobia bacterium]
MIDYAELFHTSYWRVQTSVHHDQDFFDCFYVRFLDASPEVRAKFKQTSLTQQKKMMKAFTHLDRLSAEKTADAYVQCLAQIHSREGRDIPPHLYVLWLDCLMATVRDYDPEWTYDVELAWRMALAPGITYMQFQYER